MSYPKFINYGKGTNDNYKGKANYPQNPLSYCLLDNIQVDQVHGSTAVDYAPYCKECQEYMAEKCSGKLDGEVWGPYCDFYVENNTDTYWPNQGAINNFNNCTWNCCKPTTGEMLIRNTAERRFLDYPDCPGRAVPFDPNVADSPFYTSHSCCQIPLQVIIKNIEPKTIDNDKLMNKVLENADPCATVLVYFYRDMKAGTLNLSGTKLGAYLSSNMSKYECLLNQLGGQTWGQFPKCNNKCN